MLRHGAAFVARRLAARPRHRALANLPKTAAPPPTGASSAALALVRGSASGKGAGHRGGRWHPVPTTARHFSAGREVQEYRHFKNGGGGGFAAGGFSRGMRIFVGITVAGGAAVYLSHLETIPITGRTHFVLMSHDTERKLAESQYRQVLRGAFGPVCPPGHPAVAVVERVGGRITREVGRMASGGAEGGSMGHLAGIQWRFTVVDSPEINAFVLPGGQVVVFTGLLRLLRSDRELAAVVGHEAAHVVARHAAEKVSWSQTLTLLTVMVGAAAGIGYGLLQPAVALGLELPFSRRMETEADAIGLQIMARACYDPHAAVVVFKKMAQAKKGAAQLPTYLSTHPEDVDRIEKVQAGLPEALESYNAKCSMRQGAFAASPGDGVLLR